MCISIVLDDDEVWDLRKIDFITENAEFLGLERDECVLFREEIVNNPSIPVIHYDERGRKENFRIEYNGAHAGNITLTNKYGNLWEIDVFKYPEFNDRTIVPEAIRRVIEQHPSRNWEGNVLLNNPRFDRIRSILLSLGFQEGNDVSGIRDFTLNNID